MHWTLGRLWQWLVAVNQSYCVSSSNAMEKNLHFATSIPAVFSPPTYSLIWHKTIFLDLCLAFLHIFCILHLQKYREIIRHHFTFLWTSTPHVLVSDCRLLEHLQLLAMQEDIHLQPYCLLSCCSPCELQYMGTLQKWCSVMEGDYLREHCLLLLEPTSFRSTVHRSQWYNLILASLLLYLRNLLPRCAWRLRMHQICSTVICFPYGNHSIVLMHPSYKQLCSSRGQNSFFMSCYRANEGLQRLW